MKVAHISTLVWVSSIGIVACGGGQTVVENRQGAPRTVSEVLTLETQAKPGRLPDELMSPRADGRITEQEPFLFSTNPELMEALEKKGLAIGPLVFGGGDSKLESFSNDPRFTSIRSLLKGDIQKRLKQDSKAGVGMKFSRRAFDPSWLNSDKTRFELVGVVNRLDRHPFNREYCGETRLIYRLAYTTVVDEKTVDSRLPMTVNVVFWQPRDESGGCRQRAQTWLMPESKTESTETTVSWLQAGPLAELQKPAGLLKAVEFNFQLLRWPSVMHPSLGGNAEYVLRVFERDDDVFVPVKLENVPDSRTLLADRDKKAALLKWLGENLHDIDKGIAVMPSEFANARAVSVTPRGMARLANRPFSQVFGEKDFSTFDLDGYRHIASPAALLRRLDGLSCQGCHATRSVAGFHLVGEAPQSQVLDAMALASSPHFSGEQPRRKAYLLALAKGEAESEFRPLSDFEPGGGYGTHCGLGDSGFADLRCDAGFDCVELDDAYLGTCLPKAARLAGDPCEQGTLYTKREGYKDRVRNPQLHHCDRDAICNGNAVGFPLGMCTQSCDDLIEGEACGPIVDLGDFNGCLARNRPFPDCIRETISPAGMRACDETNRCREDYICARSPYGDSGVCMPPYFLFQMRVDGHVL